MTMQLLGYLTVTNKIVCLLDFTNWKLLPAQYRKPMSTVQLFSFIPFFNEELLGDVKVALFTVLIKIQGKKNLFFTVGWRLGISVPL